MGTLSLVGKWGSLREQPHSDPRQQRGVGRGGGTGSALEGLRRSDDGAPFPGMGLVAQTSLPAFRPNTSLPKPDPACILVLTEEETWVHRGCLE